MLWRDPHAPATTPYSLLIYATDQSETPELVMELAASATTEDHESLDAWMCEVEERERNNDGDLLRVQVRPLEHPSCFCR